MCLLLADAAQGLAYLHSLDPPICHGDIKAANVLVTAELTAVICDFGLSRAVQEEYTGLTTSRTLKGSLRHLSPEILDEDPVHTLASDVWAWGCLALEVGTRTGVIPDLLPGEQFVKGDEWSAQYLTESVSAFDMDSTLVMGWVQCLLFSDDGSLFAAGHPNGVVQVYDTESGVPLGSLDPFPKKLQKEPVNNISFSPDGRYLAADGYMKIRIWDLAKLKVHQILHCPKFSGDGYTGNPLILSFVAMDVSWASRLAATSGHDNVLRLWNMDTRAHTALFQYESGFDEEEVAMQALTFSPNGALLVAGLHDGTIRIWETRGMSLIQTLELHLGAVKSLVFSGDGFELISCGEDRSINIWGQTDSASNGYRHSRTIVLDQSANWVDISTDGRWLLSASRYGELRVWDTSSRRAQLTIKLESQRSRSTIAPPRAEKEFQPELVRGSPTPGVLRRRLRTLLIRGRSEAESLEF
ncbi:hypothetical protein FS837_011404 [Tulasnella sp. UAMH 9824]|nr:hypothetical protein FS837_011404 [Tulasnella sp. UAMH 9824]